MEQILKDKMVKSARIYEGETTSNLTAFYDERTGLVNEGKADNIFLNVSKAFNTFPHNICIWKYGPGK